jgi:hypothetical protein
VERGGIGGGSVKEEKHARRNGDFTGLSWRGTKWRVKMTGKIKIGTRLVLKDGRRGTVVALVTALLARVQCDGDENSQLVNSADVKIIKQKTAVVGGAEIICEKSSQKLRGV